MFLNFVTPIFGKKYKNRATNTVLFLIIKYNDLFSVRIETKQQQQQKWVDNFCVGVIYRYSHDQ